LKGGYHLTKFFVDPGHGGKDSGAIGHGIYEKNIALDIGLKIESKLKNYDNVDVMLSRDSDIYLTLDERTKMANDWKADVYISVHVNSAANPAAKGFETFRYTVVDEGTIALQNVLHDEIYKKISRNVQDRGKKSANFHVLRESTMKAILTENLFISNPSDAALLKSDQFLNELAEGHVQGLEKFFGLKRTIRPPTNPTGTLFQVIAGTFSDYENAVRQVKKLEADGYNAYVNKKE
jgi:N-acetylmuramoyl-L-alanine amidase